jgi:hypothetical protein
LGEVILSDLLLIDSDVLIDLLRGRELARDYIRSLRSSPYMSAVTVAELYGGVREGSEREQLDRLVSGFRVVPVSEQIATTGGLLVRQYRPSHGTGLIDALIAATAKLEGHALVTLNVKHFPMLTDVVVPYVKP